MLSGLFNYENRIWRFIGKFWDVLIVHILWLFCSLPVVTIGASTTAMYYVTLKLARDDDGYTIRSFFKSFKENFRQATAIWLIFLAAGCMLGFDLFYFARVVPPSLFRTVMLSLFCAFAFVWLAMLTYVFPLQARFYNPVKRTIFNSFLMALRHMLHTIGMLAVDVLMVFLSLSYVPQLCMFGVALIAFAHSYLLNHVFCQYLPKEERPEDRELRPLFADEEEEERQRKMKT